MAASGPISIEDETGVVQLAGTATFPDGIAADAVTTPDVASGVSDNIQIKTGDAATGDTGSITISTGDAPNGDTGGISISGGDADPAAGVGGSLEIRAGDGFTPGQVKLFGSGGDPVLKLETDKLGFFDGTPASRGSVTGALSAVVDPAVAAILTSLLAAIGDAGYNLVHNGTT